MRQHYYRFGERIMAHPMSPTGSFDTPAVCVTVEQDTFDGHVTAREDGADFSKTYKVAENQN